MKVLSDKVAIVTGASRGIGKAIASKLAHEGACVVLTARDKQALDKVAAELTSAGAIATVFAADLRQPAVPGSLVDFTLGQFGRLDIVVNNAGATRRKPFLELTDEDWVDSFALKFFGSVRLARSAWFHLQEGSGSLVFVSGAGGRTPGAEFAAGGAVNAALLSLTKALSELGIRDGVQVNTVNPGMIRTDRFKVRLAAVVKSEGIDTKTAEELLVKEAKVTRIGEPEDIANLVAFIVGPEGRFLQGSLIDIDGGATKTV